MIDSASSSRGEKRVRGAHESFYIAFRLQNDLNPGIDNRWNRSGSPRRRPAEEVSAGHLGLSKATVD